MLNWISRFWRTSVIGSFLAGLLFLLPVVLTIFIAAWIINFVRGAIGPETFLGRLLTQGGTVLLGRDQDALSFWIGVGIALIGIWLLGLIVKTQAKTIVQDFLDRLITRVPLVRSIYSPVSRMVRLATDKDGGEFSSMSVVSCRFGGVNGVDILALLASQHIYVIAGERRRLVYLPTAPIPMSGGLVLAPENAITPVPEMKVDDLLKIYVSLGSLAPEAMPNAIVKTPTDAAHIVTMPPSPASSSGLILPGDASAQKV